MHTKFKRIVVFTIPPKFYLFGVVEFCKRPPTVPMIESAHETSTVISVAEAEVYFNE